MFRPGRDCLCRKGAPRLGRFLSPLCWRCSGVAAGMAATLAACGFGALPEAPLPLSAAGCVCGLPAGIDVFCQIVSAYRSRPFRRLWTGSLLGAAVVLLSRAGVSWIRSLLELGVSP